MSETIKKYGPWVAGGIVTGILACLYLSSQRAKEEAAVKPEDQPKLNAAGGVVVRNQEGMRNDFWVLPPPFKKQNPLVTNWAFSDKYLVKPSNW